jgi:3-hydroxyisobutyrate dehydrogenase-like beta-hydroxyacid dehydrogenase
MGFPMAGHLKKRGGLNVTVYNRTPEKAARWQHEYGGAVAVTPRHAAAGKVVIFACVGDDADLRAVTLGADGAFAGMTKEAIFVDHTTASAQVARELHGVATERL